MKSASRCNPICGVCGKSYNCTYMPRKNPICPDCKSIDKGNKNLYDVARKESKFDFSRLSLVATAFSILGLCAAIVGGFPFLIGNPVQ